MFPLTHHAYFALVLVLVGLAGTLGSRDRARRVLGSQVMLAGGVVLLLTYARHWGNHEGQLIATLAVIVAFAWLIVGMRWAETAKVAVTPESQYLGRRRSTWSLRSGGVGLVLGLVIVLGWLYLRVGPATLLPTDYHDFGGLHPRLQSQPREVER